MSEQYYQLTELLRHFYALIYRIALDHSCRTKAQAIITRLVEENNVTLETKKKTIMENKADFVKNRSGKSQYNNRSTIILIMTFYLYYN